jgi:hypothetical protein
LLSEAILRFVFATLTLIFSGSSVFAIFSSCVKGVQLPLRSAPCNISFASFLVFDSSFLTLRQMPVGQLRGGEVGNETCRHARARCAVNDDEWEFQQVRLHAPHVATCVMRVVFRVPVVLLAAVCAAVVVAVAKMRR